MPRQPNTRPTTIYWLYDTRTETPFYCGKTVRKPEYRLARHVADVSKTPDRKSSLAVAACNGSISIRVMEIVLPQDDWAEREKYYIAELRRINPSCANISDGGEGVPGYVPDDKTRAKLSAANSGRKLPPWQIELLRNVHLGSKHSPEHIEKTAASRRGKKRPPEVCAKIGAGNRGKVRTAEMKAKMRAAKLGKRQTPEHVANMRAAVTGKPKSEAHRLAAMEALAKVDRGPALRAAWVLRRGREAIMKCHGRDVFKECGIEHLMYPKRRRDKQQRC